MEAYKEAQRKKLSQKRRNEDQERLGDRLPAQRIMLQLNETDYT